MSYAQRIDDLIGSQIADYVWEISVKNEHIVQDNSLKMPCGYPKRVYCPMPVRKATSRRRYQKPSKTVFGNRVPRVLALKLNDGYPLGVYKPIAR